MRAARRLAAILAAACLGASGSHAAGDPVAAAGRAAKLCGDDELESAAAELRGLLASLEAEFGPGHSGPQIVRLNLAPLERALGNEDAASALEDLPPTDDAAAPLDPKLKRALRGLAVCAAASAKAPPRSTPALAEIAPEQQLKVALTLYNQGQYRKALDNAELARETAGPQAPASLVKRIYHTVALIQLQLGDAQKARVAAETAEELAKQENDAELRIALARLVAQAGDLERAITTLDEIEKGELTDLARAELFEARGDLALRLGSPKDALAALERALAGHREQFGADHPSTAAVHHLRGDAFRMAGDFPSAASAYREALRVRQKSLGRNHAETARTQNAIGVLQADLRDWRSADAAFEAALTSLDESLGADHPETLTIRANRALARWGATRDCAASADYASAMDALGGALGADHPSVSAAALNLARIEFECGHPDKADALLERALAAQRKRLGPNHPVLAATRLQRAKLLAYRGQFPAAAAEMDGALDTLLAQLGSEHPLVARTRTARSRVATAAGDPKTALAQALQASEALALHTRRTFGAISDRQRALLSQDSQEVIGALLSAQGAPARELFVSLLPHRDSVLRSIAASRAAARKGSGGEFLSELEQLRRRYVAAVHGQGPDTAERVKALASAIEGLEAMAAGAGSRMPDLAPDRALALACERLPADAALVKFAAFDRTVPGRGGGTVPAYAALVVRGGSCAVTRVALGDGEAIAKSAESFATAMREQRTDAAEDRKALSQLLLAPLSQAVAGARGWLVIPDGSLWGVPIGALPDPDDPDHYVLERVTVGYLTSTYELAERKPSGAGEDELARSLLVGAPDFGSSEHGGPVVLTSTGPCQIQPFEKLPATQQELQDIAQIIPDPHMLVGADATKPMLARELGSHPWLVHFATHAYFAGLGGCGNESSDGGGVFEEQSRPVAANPLLLSGIVMAGANNPTRVDAEVESGILTAYEVAGLDMGSAGLVVLSACDTGTGLHLRGQEVQGLRWGFRAAGARALVTSLWRSNDVATRRMMKSFYEALVSGDLRGDALRGAEALQRAQQEQLESETRLGVRRPLLWANFIFSGVL